MDAKLGRSTVICPCGEHYSIPDHFRGRVITCDVCGAEFQVPPVPAPKKPPPPKRKFRLRGSISARLYGKKK